MGDLDGAKKAQEKAIELNPSLSGPHEQLGLIYNLLGDTERAIQKIKDAIAVKDNSSGYAPQNVKIPQRQKKLLKSHNWQHLYFSPDRGGKEHFFHFFHGYMIPAICCCHKQKWKNVCFEDCGPLMNERIAEVCQMASLNMGPTIHSGSPIPYEPCEHLVPRWDLEYLLRFNKPITWEEKKQFRAKTESIRQYMLDNAQALCEEKETLDQWKHNDILVLKRSKEHPYYGPKGKAKLKKYGEGRRSLLNTTEITTHLVMNGFQAKEVDLGTLPLWEQITAFHNASCVIGVKGAEFAHLFWMQSGAAALMFETPTERKNNASKTLAEIYNLQFITNYINKNHFSIYPKDILTSLASVLKRR